MIVEKQPIVIWNTDTKKISAICESIKTCVSYIHGVYSDSKEILICYALKNTGLIKMNKNALGFNIKIKYANTEQVKLLGDKKIIKL